MKNKLYNFYLTFVLILIIFSIIYTTYKTLIKKDFIIDNQENTI